MVGSFDSLVASLPFRSSVNWSEVAVFAGGLACLVAQLRTATFNWLTGLLLDDQVASRPAATRDLRGGLYPSLSHTLPALLAIIRSFFLSNLPLHLCLLSLSPSLSLVSLAHALTYTHSFFPFCSLTRAYPCPPPYTQLAVPLQADERRLACMRRRGQVHNAAQ